MTKPGETLAEPRSELHGIDKTREPLRESYIGSVRYRDVFESRISGFPDALLRLSPAGFEGVHPVRRHPVADEAAGTGRQSRWHRSPKEIVSVAFDATPTHRYTPRLRFRFGQRTGVGFGTPCAARGDRHRGKRSRGSGRALTLGRKWGSELTRRSVLRRL
jgi:hypothetical protein